MNIRNIRKLIDYGQKHADAKRALDAWHNEVKYAQWEKPSDILVRYTTASILPKDRVVFRIKGNHFRMVVVVKYTISDVHIRFIGTHAEYDKIDAKEI